MKIEKFNEARLSANNDELDDFIEMVIKQFYTEDDLGNMGSYDAKFENNRIKSKFFFMTIDEEETNIMLDILKYYKTFDSNANFYIRSLDADREMVECVIEVNLLAYSKIYKDLEMKKNAKKYNV